MGLIKTTTYIAGGTLLSGALLLGIGPLSSYLRTSARVASDNVHAAVPASFEIERIQTLVGDLDEVIVEQQARLVEQRVDLEYLQQEVERSRERMQELEQEVGAARDVLATEQAVYRIGDRHYDRRVVVREAKSKAEGLMRAREIHAAKQQTMTALQNALDQAEAQLAKASRQRDAYGMRLAELRAKAENVAIRQELVTSLEDLPEAIDHGAFQEVEQAFKRVERELEVQDRLIEERSDGAPVPGAIDFAEADEGDVLATLDEALGRSDAPRLAEGGSAAPAMVQDGAVATDGAIAFGH